MSEHAPEALLESLCALAREAGAATMPYFRQGVAVRTKADATPVTAADLASDRLIAASLAALTPEIPAVSEESLGHGSVLPESGRRFWLVDPLDGTKEFIAGRDEFTINIALIEGGRPRLGVVHAPARDETFAGLAGEGASRRTGSGPLRAIAARRPPREGMVAVVSRSHRAPAVDAYLKTQAVKAEIAVGSAFKFCLIACGEADLYPRFGRTMEWDTAAGQAVLEAAGGEVVTFEGEPLAYGKPGFVNPDFVARGRRS